MQIQLKQLEDRLIFKQRIEEENKKRPADAADINRMMDRQIAVVKGWPPVKRIMEYWPLLFTHSQVWPTHVFLSLHFGCSPNALSIHHSPYFIT